MGTSTYTDTSSALTGQSNNRIVVQYRLMHVDYNLANMKQLVNTPAKQIGYTYHHPLPPPPENSKIVWYARRWGVHKTGFYCSVKMGQ